MADKTIDYKKMTLVEIEQAYITISDDDLIKKEELLRNWCIKLDEEGKYEEALAKTKEYIYLMLRQRFVYNEPRTFFAFKSVSDYLIQEIKTGKVSLSPADKFNDPIDPVISFWVKYQINHSKNIRFVCLLQKVVELLRIKCFVRTSALLDANNKLDIEKPQDVNEICPLMWAHYADGHRGVCLEYEIPPICIKSDSTRGFLALFPVSYEEKIELNDELKINVALSAKSVDWKYENEVRLVLFDPNTTEEFPTVEGLKLKAVYLGVNCLDSDERKIRLALLNKPVELYKMTINPKNLYRFEAKRIG
ncbi:MAG: DUF2971 domain-containing protein [Paludibacteraceae bacterium]|nr:DUF2971 domain-containing protein [Paludibacteraceae bacterium]